MFPRAQLDVVLHRIATQRHAGPWMRAIAHDYLAGPPPGATPGSDPQPLWPGGPVMRGGRYTPIGGAAAIYLADAYDVALLEVEAVVAIRGRTRPTGAQPMTVLQVDVRLDCVLDLGDGATREALGTNLQELTGNWRLMTDPPTHVLGNAVASNPRFDGLIAPSSKAPSGRILVVFAARLSKSAGTFCEVVEGGSLSQRIP